MKQRKLNYRFHNPNPIGTAANYILKVLIEANASKAEQAIQQAAGKSSSLKQSENAPA